MHAVRALLFLVATAPLLHACNSSPDDSCAVCGCASILSPRCAAGLTCVGDVWNGSCASQAVCPGGVDVDAGSPSTWADAQNLCAIRSESAPPWLVATPCDGLVSYGAGTDEWTTVSVYDATSGQLAAQLLMTQTVVGCTGGTLTLSAKCLVALTNPQVTCASYTTPVFGVSEGGAPDDGSVSD